MCEERGEFLLPSSCWVGRGGGRELKVNDVVGLKVIRTRVEAKIKRLRAGRKKKSLPFSPGPGSTVLEHFFPKQEKPVPFIRCGTKVSL